MSSETSTEPQPLQPWQLFTLAGLIGATIVVFLAKGQSPAGVLLLSLIIFTAGVVGVAVWRTCAPLAGQGTASPIQMFGGRTRAAIEREKALVLRSIKELEFDRAMGKVSDRDFAEMSARLRRRAAGLIAQLDAGVGYREQIDREIARRTGRTVPAGTSASSRPVESSSPHSPDAQSAPAVASTAVAMACRSCGVHNDLDARFCKGCGEALGGSA